MPYVWTALGRVDTADLGLVLPHEHLFINMMRERRGDGLVNDPALVTAEVEQFRRLGGRTIVDLTSAELTAGSTPDAKPGTPSTSRDPANVRAVREVARTTGVHVVLGTGHYRDPYLDRGWFDRNTVDAIAEGIVRDLTDGFAGTGVRAGIIGEIGADQWYVSAVEERSFRAAARASCRTGAAVYTHAARWPVGLAQLDLLLAEGADPARIAVGHCDTVALDGYHEDVAGRGAYVGIDTINTANAYEVDRRVALVMRLVRGGHLDRILLSQDVCLVSQLRSHGGGGYTFVQRDFRERLLAAGLTAEEFGHLTEVNPARLVAV